MYDTESSRWQAVQRRDQNASSSFVYAVISTKIYCRPGCPSRLARRANVCFYDTVAAAVAAGYRPCLRCKPDELAFVLGGQEAQRDAVKRACELIQETEGRIRFEDVAKRVGFSSRYLYGLFKLVMGTTPAKYAVRFKPGSSRQEKSSMSSTVSENFSLYSDQSGQIMIDCIDWEALLNLDCADLTAMDDNSGYSLCSNNLYDLSVLTNTSDIHQYANEAYNSHLLEPYDCYLFVSK